jgi:tRNA G18 (ribose-2'-O)-methylase SpoU
MAALVDTIAITDAADARVRDFASLTDVELRKAREPEEGLFIGEGEKVIRRALAAGCIPRAALMTSRWVETYAEALNSVACPVYVAQEPVLEQISGYRVHRGALMSFERPVLPGWRDLVRDARTAVILEDLVDHTNVGAIFRNAAALGIDAVLVTPGCADPLYRRSIKVSMGTVFAVPWTRIEPWPEGISGLRDLGFQIIAMTPDADSILRELSTSKRTAVLVGTEGDGLSRVALEQCDHRVRIPMAEGVDSLNVSAASAITFYELQRH